MSIARMALMKQPAFKTQEANPWLTMANVHRGEIIGLTLFHSVGDRDRAVEQINTDFNVFVGEVLHSMGVDPGDLSVVFDPDFLSNQTKQARFQIARGILETNPRFPVWRDQVSPVFEEWEKFYHDQSSWNEFLNSFEAYEQWMDRLQALRDSVKAQGFELHSPDPKKLPQTVFADVADTAKKIVTGSQDVIEKLLLLVAAVGIGFLVVWGIRAVRYKGKGSVGAFK
jgi:hypothetical protein